MGVGWPRIVTPLALPQHSGIFCRSSRLPLCTSHSPAPVPAGGQRPRRNDYEVLPFSLCHGQSQFQPLRIFPGKYLLRVEGCSSLLATGRMVTAVTPYQREARDRQPCVSFIASLQAFPDGEKLYSFSNDDQNNWHPRDLCNIGMP